MSKFLDKARKLGSASRAAEQASATDMPLPSPPPPPPARESIASVFAESAAAAMQDKTVRLIPLGKIITEAQVRLDFDSDYIADLAAGFGASKQPDQPVTVWANGDSFMLACGENRLRAKLRLQSENPHDPDCMVIRATVLGDMPDKYMDRQQVRVRENVLRKELTDYELQRQAVALLADNPDLKLAEIAAWFGFEKQGSAVTKISYLLKLADSPEADFPDVYDGFKSGKFGVKKALELIKEFKREEKEHIQARDTALAENMPENLEIVIENNDLTQLNDSNAAPKTKAQKKLDAVGQKLITFSLTEDQALSLMKIARKFADDNGMETLDWGGKLTRKSFNDILNSRIPGLLEIIE